MQAHPPPIVTATLDEGAFAWFEDLRQTLFPPGRNQVPAHLTLFHASPGEHEAFIAEALKAACRDRGPMRLSVRGPWFMGRGVAYRLASPELERLRSDLANAFGAWLTPQDRAPFRPHITIQNKAEPADARLLLERLQLEFEPFEVVAEGLLVWRYLAGPWEAVTRLDFGAR
jgi:2'-5' RNA ligase